MRSQHIAKKDRALQLHYLSVQEKRDAEKIRKIKHQQAILLQKQEGNLPIMQKAACIRMDREIAKR